MLVELDAHGQPVDLRLNAARRIDRGIHEMLGLVRGVLADGIVMVEEAVRVEAFIRTNPDIADRWPGDVVARRLRRIFSDGELSMDEQAELVAFFTELVGSPGPAAAGLTAAATLPLDRPAPPVTFSGRAFCFTGRFAYGTRDACEKTVEGLGGQCEGSITKRVNYVVIGTLGSRDWAHSSFGRKIQKAVTYRDERRLPLSIICEDHWAAAVPE